MRIITGKATANTKPKKICVVSPLLMPPIISSAPIAIHIQKPTLTIALSPLPIFMITIYPDSLADSIRSHLAKK